MGSEYTFERIWIPSIEQSNCLNAINDKEATQAVVAGFYANCILCETIYPGQIDFRIINLDIRDRWPKGLVRVKSLAWKVVEEIAARQKR